MVRRVMVMVCAAITFGIVDGFSNAFAQVRAGAAPSAPPGAAPAGKFSDASTSPPAMTSNSGLAEGNAKPVGGLLPEVIYLPNNEGRLVPVPADATLAKYLEWLRVRPLPRTDHQAGYSLAEADLVGLTDDDQASLTARVHIQVHEAVERVIVPLGFTEAVVAEADHDGPGESGFDRFDRETGLRWWFRGAGLHTLTLTLKVPLKRQVSSRRLQLTMPATAVSHLRLLVPDAPLLVKAPEQAALQTRQLGGDQTEIELFGLGARVDVNWQRLPNPEDVETALEVNTSILARLAADSMVVEAAQRVRALQGAFDKLTVRLPPGSELISIDGKEYLEHKVDPDDSSRVTVSLTSPASGLVTLNWAVRLGFGEQNRATLEGFVVEGARKQNGDIGLVPLEGLRLTVLDTKDPNVVRMSAGEWRSASGAGQIARAYRFLNQPFRLTLSTEPVQPYFTVDTQLLLIASTDQLRLDVQFPVKVFRGSLQDVTVNWPNWRTDGWLIDSIEPKGPLVDSFTFGETPDGRPLDDIRIRLLDRKSEDFQIRLTARRPFKPNESPEVSFPQMVSSSPLPSTLFAFNDEKVESEILAVNKTTLRPLPVTLRKKIELPDPFRTQRHLAYRIDANEQRVSLRVTAQSRRITFETNLQAEVKESQLIVAQELKYDVQYERIGQLRLVVPESIAGQAQFFAADNTELTPVWNAELEDGQRTARLPLEAMRLGQFSITARFQLPLVVGAAGEFSRITVPIIQSLDAPASLTSFLYATGQWLAASTEDTTWSLRRIDDDRQRWTSTLPKSSFHLQLVQAAAGEAEPFYVRRSLIRAVADGTGAVRYRADLRVSGRPKSVNVALPGGMKLIEFRWNSNLIELADLTETPVGSNRFTLRPKEKHRASGEENLTVEYASAPAVSAGLRGWESPGDLVALVGPQLPQAAWVSQVIWQVLLPNDRYLFNYPPTITPLFRWRRDGLFFRRVSEFREPQLAMWLASGKLPFNEGLPLAVMLEANSYYFTQFGQPVDVSIRTMTAPMVLFLGAGSSLAFGFLFLRFRMMRHVLTFLALAFAVALVGLWARPPLELLLQPILLGLVFPLAAVLIELKNRRRKVAQPVPVTVGYPEELVTQAYSAPAAMPSVATTFNPAPELGFRDAPEVAFPATTPGGFVSVELPDVFPGADDATQLRVPGYDILGSIGSRPADSQIANRGGRNAPEQLLDDVSQGTVDSNLLGPAQSESGRGVR